MRPLLTEQGERIRRMVMHRVTRFYNTNNKETQLTFPESRECWNLVKDVVQEALSEVLAEELTLRERKRDRNSDDG